MPGLSLLTKCLRHSGRSAAQLHGQIRNPALTSRHRRVFFNKFICLIGFVLACARADALGSGSARSFAALVRNDKQRVCRRSEAAHWAACFICRVEAAGFHGNVRAEKTGPVHGRPSLPPRGAKSSPIFSRSVRKRGFRRRGRPEKSINTIPFDRILGKKNAKTIPIRSDIAEFALPKMIFTKSN